MNPFPPSYARCSIRYWICELFVVCQGDAKSSGFLNGDVWIHLRHIFSINDLGMVHGGIVIERGTSFFTPMTWLRYCPVNEKLRLNYLFRTWILRGRTGLSLFQPRMSRRTSSNFSVYFPVFEGCFETSVVVPLYEMTVSPVTLLFKTRLSMVLISRSTSNPPRSGRRTALGLRLS